MQHSAEILVCEIFILFGYFCCGIPDERGLIIGTWNPSTFVTFTEIPKSVSSSSSNITVNVNPSEATIFSLAFDPTAKGAIFAAIWDSIYVYDNFSIWQNHFKELPRKLKKKSVGIGQIAVDFVSHNLYWCDSLHNWIAMKPAYNFNSVIYKVIVHKELNQPEGLALDPEDRLMFFSNNGPSTRIEKASLDGDARVIIVYKGLIRVISLTVDTDNDKLYWTDYERKAVESSNYDGSDRRFMHSVSATEITYYQNFVYAANPAIGVIVINTKSGSQFYMPLFDSKHPVSITVYDAESTGEFYDPCLAMNCHHMCINTQLGPRCLCSEGFDLDSNGKNCTDRSWFFKRGFIVSNSSMFAMHEVHTTNGESNAQYTGQISGVIIEAITVDATSDVIYFIDSGSNTLKKYDIISQETSNLTSLTSAKDLMFDWIANLLGWIEPMLGNIISFSINSKATVTIYSDLQKPASLTVDHHKGALYWISGTSMKSIVGGSWTRDKPNILISAARLNDPVSLQHDLTDDRLYWFDRMVIKSSMTNGMDIKSHVYTHGATKIFVYKGYLGWIYGDSIYFARKILREKAENILQTVQKVKDVAVFDSSLQQDKRGTCHILNGGCGEICLPIENGRRCECDVGLQVQPDNSCDGDVLLENFMVVKDVSQGRILQVDLHTGSVVKLPPLISKVAGLALDKSTITLFYFDQPTSTIMTTTLHGRNTTPFYKTVFADATNLAIDFSTGNVYFSPIYKENQTFIGVIHRTKSLHKTLIDNIHRLGSIALYPSKGYIFWSESRNEPKITRANMDGTVKIYILTTNLAYPAGITIDHGSNRLFWMDSITNCIESSDLNGGHRQILACDSGALLGDILSYGKYIYYTAHHRRRVTKIDKSTGHKVSFMRNHPELGLLINLDIFTGDISNVSSDCSTQNGFCSTFCFPTSTGRTCGCQDKVNLLPDQLTCEGVPRCPTDPPNLNFIECAPYPGLSCHFKCKNGYRIATRNTVYCDSEGNWSPPTDTLCIVQNSLLEASETNIMYLRVGISVAGILVVSIIIAGVVCLKKRSNTEARNPTEDPSTNTDTSIFLTIPSVHFDHFDVGGATEDPYLTPTIE